jgi:hypothetical protein
MSKAILPSLDAPLWSRWLLTLLLPLFALMIYWEGQDYESGLLQLEAPGQTAIPPVPEQLLSMPRFGQLRSYHADNLYEYINGHAEYYLSAGFQSLTVAEFAPDGAQQPQLVVNLYHMGEPLFAFGVLMNELAPDAVHLEGVGSMAFTSGSGLNLILGPYYVQLSSFSKQADLHSAALDLGESLRGEIGEVAEFDLSFPDLGEPLATYFVKEDYRGLDFLHNVLERVFQRGDEEITLFLINGDEEIIDKTGRKLMLFLQQDGIPFEQQTFEGMTYHLVDDPYEGRWFFVLGQTRLLGAFAEPDPDLLISIQGKSSKKGQIDGS